MAGSIEVLDITRGVQGIGGALMFATSLSLLAEAFPATEERVKALAAYGASIGAAFAVGPLVGGALTSAFGWQAVFFVNVPLSAIEAGLVYMPGTVVMFVVSGLSAQVANKVAPGVMIAGGLTHVAAGMLLFLNADVNSSWTALEPGFLLASIGTGLFNPAVSAVALGSAPQHMSGLAAGVNDTFRQAGIAVGVAAFGAVVPAS